MMIKTEHLVLAAIVVLCIVISRIWQKKRSTRKTQQQIKESWGKQPEEMYGNEQMSSISSYFLNYRSENKDKHFIDDITWNDLEMDRIFMRINNTNTTVGEENLYSLLREPLFDAAALFERDRLMEFFKTHFSEREKLQFVLAGLGKRKFVDISDYFYNPEKRIKLKGFSYKVLSCILLFSPLLFIFSTHLGLFVFLSIFITNIITYYKAKNEIASQLEALGYIVDTIRCARKICNLDIPEINKYTGILLSSIKSVRGIAVNFFYKLFYSTNDPIFEYIRVVLLGELIAFESFFKLIHTHREDLKRIYRTIGLIDTLISIASYRETLGFYKIPELREHRDNPSVQLNFTDIYHPLLKEPVFNSIDMDGPILLTGSNASGKSTFLKSIAVNAIFAQTIHTCLAKTYNSYYFKIYTSMALKDSIINKESYFIVEIKSLKRVLDSLEDDIPCLCLIDEVLRGTNTIERIAASSEVLDYLGRKNCLCIAATHDIELTTNLSHLYKNYHFRESFVNNEIVFDYKIHPGSSNTRNAIKLLELMGYDSSIVAAANKRAQI